MRLMGAQPVRSGTFNLSCSERVPHILRYGLALAGGSRADLCRPTDSRRPLGAAGAASRLVPSTLHPDHHCPRAGEASGCGGPASVRVAAALERAADSSGSPKTEVANLKPPRLGIGVIASRADVCRASEHVVQKDEALESLKPKWSVRICR
jgi:hypothetical protein